MPRIQYSRQDLLRDKIVEPAWYRVRIDTVGEWTPSKAGDSQNMVIEGTILFNADNGDKTHEGVPIGGIGSWSFNTKALGFSLGLTKSVASQLGLDPNNITEKQEFEYGELEGKEVDVWIENDTYEGRTKNKVTHKYRQPRS